MSNKAVFIDRDHTLIEDPGYISAPEAVKLLPGVELALKSLSQAGYKIVVVTNQSGIARGLLTEETLEKIHAEMRRQLSEKGAHLDAIYYCPYHPEGTIERYAGESDLRKPQPGMLLQGSRELDIDLSQSWMVGDSPRDIEAGQRAGCRTIRVRVRVSDAPGQVDEESAQADFTVRNLVDAARVILREPTRQPVVSSGLHEAIEHPQPQAQATEAPDEASPVQQEILDRVRKLTAPGKKTETFSLPRMLGALTQVLTLLGVLITFVQMYYGNMRGAIVWAIVSATMQIMTLTLFVAWRRD